MVIKTPEGTLRAGDYGVQPGSDQIASGYQNQSVPDVIWVLASPLGFNRGDHTSDEDAGHGEEQAAACCPPAAPTQGRGLL